MLFPVFAYEAHIKLFKDFPRQHFYKYPFPKLATFPKSEIYPILAGSMLAYCQHYPSYVLVT